MALLVPRGWYNMEQFNYVRTFQDLAIPGADATNRVIFPQMVDANQAKADRLLSRQNALLGHYFFSRLLMPAMGKAPPAARRPVPVVTTARMSRARMSAIAGGTIACGG